MTTYTSKVGAFLLFVCLPVGAAILGYYSIVNTWKQIESNAEMILYSEGDGYAFITLFLPFFYVTFFPKFKKYQKYTFFTLAITSLISLLITPRVIDYITEEKLIAKGYTYCDYKRTGSIRHLQRTWQRDPACQGQTLENETSG